MWKTHADSVHNLTPDHFAFPDLGRVLCVGWFWWQLLAFFVDYDHPHFFH
jgi:hypothetical protein